MKKKYLLAVVVIVATTKDSFAQFSQDAIRFSTSQTGSTARLKAIGNATTAIGGDLSSISSNAAGLGFYTSSDASFTPEFNLTGVKATYLGQTNNANSNNVNFNNAAVVFYNKLNSPAGANKGEGWLSVNFGASFNRTADYYENISYRGTNTKNSITNYYADLANSQGVDYNGSALQDDAANHIIIDKHLNDPLDPSKGFRFQSNVFGTSPGVPNQPVNQADNIIRDGGRTEFDFSVGANYSNQFYIGGGIGITSIRYNMTRTFTESGIANIQPTTTAFNNPYTNTYSQVQATTGTGFNARIGFIYKLIDAIRIGGTVTTPTWYTMQDDFSENLQTVYGSPYNQSYGYGPVDYQTTYSFSSPWRLSAGIAAFIGKSGFITGDFEYLDYSSVSLSSGDGYSNSSDDNHSIKTAYKSTVNAHVGGELKLDMLYLRAGYGIQGSPPKGSTNTINTVSGGLGYHIMNYYIDATYTNSTGTQLTAPYNLSTGTEPTASLNKTSNNVFLTFGMRF
ncbi:hypothetical protein KXQ82_04170 [Mucilaginibacter sp. HMF5004]|uniref:hypothetical protein n=1 Tax=Mucilaginibacter rivuli TaxID=2857527 RepID=UPI001C5DA1D2|nr:hypothetical protein [Mucilaginibacter rivuli]MBW4888892.1 hypothetical protein [Mucilaginibacter rivuli]